jgi:hypothetical protein
MIASACMAMAWRPTRGPQAFRARRVRLEGLCHGDAEQPTEVRFSVPLLGRELGGGRRLIVETLCGHWITGELLRMQRPVATRDTHPVVWASCP